MSMEEIDIFDGYIITCVFGRPCPPPPLALERLTLPRGLGIIGMTVIIGVWKGMV